MGSRTLRNNLLREARQRVTEAPLEEAGQPWDPGARTRWREPGGRAVLARTPLDRRGRRPAREQPAWDWA